jgi:hypothetical protein
MPTPRDPIDRGSQFSGPLRELRRGRSFVSLLILLSIAAPALAVGIGGFEVQSSLGERLRLVVQLTSRADEVVEASCFRVNPSAVASDGLPQVTNAQLSLDRGASGQARLIVTSPRPLNDPIVRVSIEVGCDTTLRRDLTLLIDPAPVIANAPETSPATAPASDTATAPATAAAAGGAATGVAAGAQPSEAAGAGAGASSGGTSAGSSGAAPGSAASANSARSRGAAQRAPAAAAAGPQRRSAERSAARAEVSRQQAGTREQPRVSAREVPFARESASRVPPRSAAAPQPPAAQRDRLTISASRPALDSSMTAPLSPKLTLSTSLSDRAGKAPLPESVLGILREKQARLRAAPADEDIPSLEAEIVVLQKRAADLRSQLDAAMAQAQALAASVSKSAPDPAAPAAPAAAVPATPPASAAASASAPAATPVQSLPGGALSHLSWLDTRTLLAAALALVVALLIAVLVMWIRRERADRRRQERWNQSPYVPATSTARSPDAMPASTARLHSSATESGLAEGSVPVATRPVARVADSNDPFSSYDSRHAASELGVSDLAQATEKASVFVTLGRHEQAIDVLRDHIDHEPKPSPMAWLMLLDLYRQSRQRAEFADVAERFHQAFNAELPKWELPNHGEDPGLVSFPQVIGRIRQEWPHTPSLAYIESLLYDNRGGSRIGFSLAAFRDLLLLHSILDEYRIELAEPAQTNPVTGAPIPVPIPDPPSHLARAWLEAPASAPSEVPLALELDVALLGDSRDASALEKGLPTLAAAIVARWGRTGVSDYLTNLIALSKDDRNSEVSPEMMAELVLLQEVAGALDEEQSDLSL